MKEYKVIKDYCFLKEGFIMRASIDNNGFMWYSDECVEDCKLSRSVIFKAKFNVRLLEKREIIEEIKEIKNKGE